MKDPRGTLNSVLRLLATRNPAIYDAIFPRQGFGTDVADMINVQRRFLDPQPLPPRHGGRFRSFATAPEVPEPSAMETGFDAASDFLQLAWTARSLSIDLGKTLNVVDDWCGTGPVLIKLPPHRPTLPPRPRPEWMLEFQLGLLLRLSAVSVDDKALATAVNKAMDKVAARLETTLSEVSG
jgi:hypothetical protein